MNDYRYPEERKRDHVEYVLHKYLNSQLQYKLVFNKLTDEKLAKIIKDIKED